MTPCDLWKEIVDKQNIALAILVGFMSLGIAHHHRRGRALSPAAHYGDRSLSLRLPDRRLRADL